MYVAGLPSAHTLTLNRSISMIIYQITNTINNDFYIGKTTKSVEDRFQRHQYLSDYGSKYHIHSAMRKYGKENFKLTILEDNIQSEMILNEREMFYIKKLNPNYNSTLGGEGTLGLKRSQETIKKMSDSAKGRKVSEETKNKIRNKLKGKKLDQKTIEKMKISRLGEKNPFYGKKHTEETKLKISNSKKGQQKGRFFSEEHRKKLSESAKKRYRTNP